MTKTAYGKVAVLLGGTSNEREVSLKSGKAVLTALKNKGIDAHAVDVGKDIIDVLRNGKFDRAFIILHGRGGEDGVIQALLEMLEIPYTGSGVLGSALSMDKVRSKEVWKGFGLPTLPFEMLHAMSDFAAVAGRIGFPMAVKASHEGSSIGTYKVNDVAQLQKAYTDASQFDSDVFVEPWVVGKEYTVAILGDNALPVIRMETPRTFYDFEAKYQSNDTKYHCPSGLSDEDEFLMKDIATKAFRAVGAYGWGRVDIMCDSQGRPWLLENNTAPGMTDHSLVPMAAKVAGMEFDDLVVRILDTSVKG